MSKENMKGILTKMNRILADAIHKYDNDEIEEEELKKLLDQVEELKKKLLEELPDIWHIPFKTWYINLHGINSSIFMAKDTADEWYPESITLQWVKNAKKYKENIETLVFGE